MRIFGSRIEFSIFLFLYVDKTAMLYNLITQGRTQFFLSRPRRFGKTLFDFGEKIRQAGGCDKKRKIKKWRVK
ncbi:MAG: AAA family ATPase [Candidatus Fibromonas sp.]|jgi:hypothetical protein|nr:AAA family ATPase [Candidatus Fibromonas sp.]